jgi:apolipoprotein N-acyltransferase
VAARGPLVAVGSGVAMAVLYAAAFPPLRWRATAWIAMAPLLVAVRRGRARDAVIASVAFALLGCALTISWIPRAAALYYGQPLWIGIATFLGIALVMVAPYVTAFALLYRIASRRRSPGMPLVGASLWVCAEYARSYALTGNPFALLGYSQASGPWMRQIADLGGVYAVAFLLAAANVALAECWVARRDPALRRSAAQGAALTVVLVVAVSLYGRARFADRQVSEGVEARVLAVQGNVDLGAQWQTSLYGENLERYLRLTIDGIGSSRPDLVVWPENAMTFFLDREPVYRAAIGHVLQKVPTQLLTGGPHAEQVGGAFLNSAFLVLPSGEIAARYDKEKLLPFAEYFPLPQLDVLRRSFGRVREFTPGAASTPLETAAGPAGVLICNEAMFPEIPARRVRAGAELLVNLANDSWIGDAQYSELALDMSILRAVEQRRYLVRASTSGPSAIIDPLGTVRERTATAAKATLRGTVERRSEMTIYAALGDLFVAGCAIAACLGVWRGARPRSGVCAARPEAAPPE